MVGFHISHQNLIRKKNGKFKRSEIRNSKSRRFSVQINDNLFLRNSYSKKIFKRIKRSKIKSLNKYEYSDFSFYVPKLIEKISGSNFEKYFYDNIINKKNITLLLIQLIVSTKDS